MIGFMGTGKTEVGRLIAERCGLPFIDTDQLVEELAGATIPQLWAEGERPVSGAWSAWPSARPAGAGARSS
ncbi:MAG: shikimate kinase, partial [Bacillota bacterium]|nr:shikimate kinase [Bacillota bacterium]